MTTLKIEGMHCGGCVARIEKALGAKGYNFSVSLEKNIVEIEGGADVVADATEIIKDLGFDVI